MGQREDCVASVPLWPLWFSRGWTGVLDSSSIRTPGNCVCARRRVSARRVVLPERLVSLLAEQEARVHRTTRVFWRGHARPKTQTGIMPRLEYSALVKEVNSEAT